MNTVMLKICFYKRFSTANNGLQVYRGKLIGSKLNSVTHRYKKCKWKHKKREKQYEVRSYIYACFIEHKRSIFVRYINKHAEVCHQHLMSIWSKHWKCHELNILMRLSQRKVQTVNLWRARKGYHWCRGNEWKRTDKMV